MIFLQLDSVDTLAWVFAYAKLVAVSLLFWFLARFEFNIIGVRFKSRQAGLL